MKTIVAKTLFEKRWFAIGWSAAFAATALLVIVFYPSFSATFQYDELASQLPDQLKGLLGNADSFKTLPGYIASQLFSIRIPLFMLIMAIVLGLGLTITQEESGRMRSLAALPKSRAHIALSLWLASVIIVACISVATTIALYISIVLIDEPLPHTLIWQLTGLSWLFGTAACSIVLALGLASGKRALTTAVALIVTIGSFIITTFGNAVSWLEPWERFSLLHYYDASALASSTFDTTKLLVLIVVIIVSFGLGIVLFRKRDISS